MNSGVCYQGQIYGYKGFLLDGLEVGQMFSVECKNVEVIFLYFMGDELFCISLLYLICYVIDFQLCDVFGVRVYKLFFVCIECEVLFMCQVVVVEEEVCNVEVLVVNLKVKINKYYCNFLNQWWVLLYGCSEMIEKILLLSCYIVCLCVIKR